MELEKHLFFLFTRKSYLKWMSALNLALSFSKIKYSGPKYSYEPSLSKHYSLK